VTPTSCSCGTRATRSRSKRRCASWPRKPRLSAPTRSHSYLDGGCLYFTFAGKVEPDDKDRFYRAIWDAGQGAVLANGGALSHHHGVGLNRSRFVREALGPAFDVLAALKDALDPNGILNPGKLGLASPFGETGY
jgi:alkyldihydroxyacetonephosphate synthase